MRLISSPEEISAAFGELLAAHRQVSFAVAWASTGFAAYDALKAHAGKIRRGIVGTHFHQTHPDFIRAFQAHPHVRFVLDAGELFHPKIYLFESGETWACIIGSANLTAGGFTANREAVVLLDGKDDVSLETRDHIRGLLADYWASAAAIADDELEKYEEVWRRHQRLLNRASGRYGGAATGAPIERIGILKLSWREFVAQASAKGGPLLAERARVLAGARALFQRHAHFSQMSDTDRKAIAGMIEPHGIE